MGPDFCGKENCVGTCDQKSECDPGWGMQWSKSSKCPLDVCCSKFGFCGTTKDFCGNKTVERPACSLSTKVDKVIGYYESWSLTERSCGGMTPEQIPYGVYTHLNFAFATIDPSSFEVKATSDMAEALMSRIGNVRLLQAGVEIWIAIGGWTFSDSNQATHKTFSDLAASEKNQDAFANSLISMMNTYGFDGVDIDWEYPVADDRGGRKEDYENFVTWMKRLKAKLGKKGLTVTLPSSYWYLQHFDIKGLEKHVDWFNVMLYDLHGSWDEKNEWTGPFINSHTNLTEIQDSLDLLWRNKIDPDKVVFGMAFYGRSFTLTDPSCSEPKCIFSSGGNAGECSNTVGVLLNPEIQRTIQQKNLKPKSYTKEAIKAINWDSQWVSFDDKDTWTTKSNLAKKQCIKGMMVWAVSHDDLNGTSAYALTKAIGREVMDSPKIEPQPVQMPPRVIETCRWSNCNEQCPQGFKNVKRDGTEQMMVDDTGCPAGQSPHQLCCPGDFTLPTCTWRGFRNSGACKPGCNSGEAEVGTLVKGCSSRHQSACCTTNTAVQAYADCKWVGESGLCSKSGSHKDCPSDYPKFIVASSAGAGGEQVCSQGAKSYCCKDPAPSQWTDCAWHQKATSTVRNTVYCETSCPAGQIRIAMQKGDCRFGGWGAYCCKGKPAPTLQPRDPNWGNNQYEDFVDLLEKYLKAPTCPANELSLDGLDYFFDTPAKRAECAIDDFSKLVTWAGTLLQSPRITSDVLKYAWDNRLMSRFDTTGNILSFDNLVKYVQDGQFDAHAVVQDLLLNPEEAAGNINSLQKAQKALCVNVSTLKSKSRNSSHSVLESRNNNSSDDTLETTILDGIMRGDLTLVYSRWQYMTGANGFGSHNQAGAFLEIGYWIGPTPGTTPTDVRFNRYRDTTTNRRGPDNWVMIHVHVDANHPNLFRNIDGNVFIGTPSVRMYHAQTASWPQRIGADRRVDNRDVDRRNPQGRITYTGINSRSGLFPCPPAPPPRANAPLWYMGDITAPVEVPPSLLNRLEAWGQRLWDQRYIHSQGLSNIFHTSNWAGNQFDLNQGIPVLQLPWRGIASQDPTLTNVVWDPATSQFVQHPNVP
ncbi:glycoside hydrolase family 18 protein [Aaosphaeria arxii CBS 175.79]|uniref:chitinase n=1 Tax=Aaosphaeria arxii CBS 175.79 TaxID=1450172 RepID=A0A6A5XXX9_9PLEO|nr:glycoside hydrolase family 18 protein [Aaosphaeria arxii CBS 175.79]KAF2018022.1 glycoside hydrolase family 18 protein [Aaosphaeria arxii CBS 175.79]